MAQITIYLPDDLAAQLKQQAKADGRSVSALLTELARQSLQPNGWPEGFFELFGSGSLEEAEELEFEERDPW